MSVLEHSISEMKQHATVDGHGSGISSSSSSGPRDQLADTQPVEKVSWIGSAFWRKRAQECPPGAKPLVYPGELNLKSAAWSTWARRLGFCWLQSSWRIYLHWKVVGWWGMSSPFPHLNGRLPPEVPSREVLPCLRPTSRAVQSGVAGNSCCCSVMLKAEKYDVKIFMHKGKSLIF